MKNFPAYVAASGGFALVLGVPLPLSAQEDVQLEEVLVTARKREESLLRVPVSLTRFDGSEVDRLKMRDLTRMTTGLPGVALDDVGTRRGTANFSIRGLGINSSIPSIEPTVGIFVNGVYIGINNDVIFDVFDLESVEVLRGPQGVLFGRNVTGGAILMHTRRPEKTAGAEVQLGLEGGGDGGNSRILSASVTGPLTDSLSGRLSVYTNDDDGYFRNEFDGADFGALDQRFIRASLSWEPSDKTQFSLMYEKGDLEGEGAAAQSHENGSGVPGSPESFPRDSLRFSIDERGYQFVDSDFLTLEWRRTTNAGEWTNIFGWRDQSSEAMSDIDSQPVSLFHSPGWIDYEQWSNELRYSAQVGDRFNYLAGIYLFQSDLAYHDRRLFLGETGVSGSAEFTQDGGGEQRVETAAMFVNGEYSFSDQWTVSAGLRLSSEEKRVRVASFNLNSQPCNIVVLNDCPFDFRDSERYDTLAPSVTLQFAPDADSSAYLSWSRSYRSGGYNLRNSNSAETPGPVDEETVDGFELGYKRQGERWRASTALFYTYVADMQREVNLPSETAGILQLVRNTADAEIAGLEIDGQWLARDGLTLAVNAAYLHASYRSVRFDLNGDGAVDGVDRDLDLPRAPEWTWGASVDYSLQTLLSLDLSARLSYSYRDEVAYTDNNLGFILEQELLDADLRFRSAGGNWELTAYARNLLNSVKHGGDSQLPAVFIGQPLGGTFSPLARGRMVGVSVEYRFSPQ